MASSKTEDFTLRENRIAEYAKALSHPARIAILHHLSRQKDCYCGDIVEELPLSQSTVSQHLKELKEAGLITGEISGRNVCYCINEKEWESARKHFEFLFDAPAKGYKCC